MTRLVSGKASGGSLPDMYGKLFSHFGPQHWWPARTAFEVMVGAVLTQNTNWANVEKAVQQLRRSRCLSVRRINAVSLVGLARMIRSSGYHTVKARRLKCLTSFLTGRYGGSIRRMSGRSTPDLRRELLQVNGIGKETADSILLYALHRPVFVVDAYTRRIFFRHGLVHEQADYDQVQSLCMGQLEPCPQLFNEFHALLVRLGKDYCLKRKPRCQCCPLRKKA